MGNYRKTIVCLCGIENEDIKYEGYINEYRWNGFEVPYFDFDTMLIIVNRLQTATDKSMLFDEDMKFYYDKEMDSVVCARDLGGYFEKHIFEPKNITLENGQTMKAYGFGEGWTWYEDVEE